MKTGGGQPIVAVFGATPGNARSLGDLRQVSGIRRYAMALGWEIAVFAHGAPETRNMPALLAKLKPVGCIVFDNRNDGSYPASIFGDLPIVYLDGYLRRRHDAPNVYCDNAAVTRFAFAELSAGLPESYAFVPSISLRFWNAERRETFRELCAEAGKPCRVFAGKRGETAEERLARLRAWTARLPRRCAIFAANDNCACDVAAALAAAGRSVPRDNTIVGADGDETAPDGGDVSRISSVRIDVELAGYLAAKTLAEIVEGATDGKHEDVPYGPLMVVRRESTRGFGRHEPHILEAVETIRREACGGLTAAALAKRFPGSRNLFERRFREATGHSVLDEILHVRLQRALALLARPEVPISAIADFSGFSSQRELRQLFLRRFRCSMREWRKSRPARRKPR